MGKTVAIIGAGLAGCEAALSLADFGHHVVLYEQKPLVMPDVYHMPTVSELVCNNSLGPRDVNSPLGLLIYELATLQSNLINLARECTVDDSLYFAIDKLKFSEKVTKAIIAHPGINIISKRIEEVPEADNIIIASGPLTNEHLLASISEQYGMKGYHFSDASSSVVNIKSIDLSNKHITQLSEDLFVVYIPDNILTEFCSLLAEYYRNRHENDSGALHECLSIEQIASQGKDVLNHIRLTHAGIGSNCLLLRRENGMQDGFIIVGSMTTLRHAEQRKVFSLLPGFSNVRFQKYGRMHRNTFFSSPGILNSFYQIAGTNTYIIGQLSGIDGYTPAISSGLVAALHIHYQNVLPPIPKDTMIGGLANYVSNTHMTDFQPMCASYSLLFGGSDREKNEVAQKSIVRYKKTIMQLQATASC